MTVILSNISKKKNIAVNAFQGYMTVGEGKDAIKYPIVILTSDIYETGDDVSKS